MVGRRRGDFLTDCGMAYGPAHEELRSCILVWFRNVLRRPVGAADTPDRELERQCYDSPGARWGLYQMGAFHEQI